MKMKKRTLSFTAATLLVAIPLLTACSEDPVATPTPQPTPSQKASQPDTVSPNTTVPNGIQANENAPLPAPNPNENIHVSDEQWIAIQPDAAKLQQIQADADQGHATAYMTPESAAREFVANATVSDSKDDIKSFATGEVNTNQWESDGLIKIAKDNKILVLRLDQPVKKGDGGIWYVNALFTVQQLQPGNVKF